MYLRLKQKNLITRKQLIIFVLALTAFGSYAQDQSKEKAASDYPRVQIGISVSPDICYRSLKNNDGSSASDLVIKMNNENQIAKAGYTTGLNVCFSFNKVIGLETGIQYSNKGYKTKVTDLVSEQSDPTQPEKSRFIYDFHCIDIPVKVNFSVGKKKVRFFTSIGLTTNIFVKETTTIVLVYSDRTDRKTEPTNFDYHKVNISPTLSAGIDYKINSRMNVRVEPTFRYGVLKIIDTPVTGYLYSGGVNISYYQGL